ncbi:Tautomerase [Polynucleobacter antarcticus]
MASLSAFAAFIKSIIFGRDKMPLIQIQLFEGRSDEVKREYAQAITEAAVKIMGCSADSVDIIYQDVKKSDWATAGKMWSD